MAVASLANHITNFKTYEMVISILLIILDVLVLVFSIVSLLNPAAEFFN